MSLPLTIAAAAMLAAGTSGVEAPGASVTAPRYVFFDFGRPMLSRDAEAILDQAIAESHEKQSARIEVDGFSDAAGPSWANATVSGKRADVVKAYLVAHGLRSENIRVSAHGESGLLIPTADGVREPQNRRVEVRVIE